MWGTLPDCLSVNGKEYTIRTDFRDIIKILIAFNDPELEENEKVYICLFILYEDFEDIPQDDYEAAFKAAISFIDNGIEDDSKNSPHLVDWEQDEKIMIPAVNKVAGFDIRTKQQLHWWTFLGYYMEIGDGVFSQVVAIRNKKAKGKKLEKHEQEFYKNNKTLCNLAEKLTKEEQEKLDRLNALLD